MIDMELMVTLSLHPPGEVQAGDVEQIEAALPDRHGAAIATGRDVIEITLTGDGPHAASALGDAVRAVEAGMPAGYTVARVTAEPYAVDAVSA